MRQLTVSTGESRETSRLTRKTVSWGAVKRRLGTHARMDVTLAEYMALDKNAQTAHKDRGYYVLGAFSNDLRRNEEFEFRDAVVLDIDDAPADLLVRLHTAYRGTEVFIHSTTKHQAHKPRFRVVMPTDRRMSPVEFEALSRAVAAKLDIALVDPISFRAAQMVFFPVVPSDAPVVVESWAGEWLPVGATLDSTYLDWTDRGEWPRKPGDLGGTSDFKKLGDPREKKGLIGAFCRAYDLHRALDELIPGVYEGEGQRRRFAQSEGGAGAAIYDDGHWMFSNHTGHDPAADGHSHNAYDLVRIHRFGGDDAQMRAFAVSLQDVVDEMPGMAPVEEAFEEVETVDQATGEITTRMAPVGQALLLAVNEALDDDALQAIVKRVGIAALDDMKTDGLLRAITARYRELGLSSPGLPVLRKAALKARAAMRSVPSGITVVDPSEVTKTADTVMAAMAPNGELVRWKASNYRYVGGRFEEVADPLLLPSAVLRCLTGFYQPGKDGAPPAPLLPGAAYAREIANEVMAQASFDVADLPAWRGTSQWSASDTVSLQNGLLHIPTRRLVAHTPDFVSTGQLTFGFDADARCPAWESFVHNALDGDRGSVELLQEMFGYLLGGRNDRHAIFYLLGVPGSGKSTVGSVLSALMAGDCAATSIETLGSDFGLQNLVGRRVAIMGDQNEEPGRGARLALARLKSISGGDAVDVNRKGLPMVTAVLPTRFVIISNDLVRLPDSSGALKRRYFLVRFKKGYEYRKARGEEADTGLVARLLAELPGIFNWALAGWSRLAANGGFRQPDESKDVLSEMHHANDPLSAFAEDCLVFGQHETPSAEIYEAYKSHHASTGGDTHEFAKNALIRKLNMKYADRISVVVRKIEGRSTKVCVGLKIQSEWSEVF